MWEQSIRGKIYSEPPQLLSAEMPASQVACHLGVSEAEVEHMDLGQNAFVEGSTVNLLVCPSKMSNYLRCCTGWLSPSQMPHEPVQVVRRYTSEKGGFCYKLNLGLATDNANILTEHALYVRQLKYCIGKHGFQPSTLYRGVELTVHEIRRIEELGTFYIPGFTSTSDDPSKAFNKNTKLVIDASRASWALKIQTAWSDYPESEVLLSCYTLFEYQGADLCCQPQLLYLKVLEQKHAGC